MTAALVPAAVGLAVVFAGLGLTLMIYLLAVGGRQQRLEQRLQAGASGGPQEPAGDSKWLMRAADRGRSVDRLLQNEEGTSYLLDQAGWRSVRVRAAFYALQILLPLSLAVVALVFWLLFAQDADQQLLFFLLGLAAVIAGFLLPRVVLRRAASHRQERFRQETPMFINLLILLFEAGLSTRQALASLVRDTSATLPEISAELKLAVRQIEAGAELSEVLDALAQSVDVPEFTNVLGILRQIERYGGEVREPLTEALNVMEERHNFEIREQVNRIAGNMTFVMVLCFFPALLIFVAGPAVTSIIIALGNVAGGS